MQDKVICAFLNCGDKELALSMLSQLSRGPFDVLMLDNGGLTAEQIKDSGYNLQVVQTDENVMWGPGVNALMEWVIENRPQIKAVWVCNDDIQGANQRMAATLYATLSATGAAAVSPSCDASNIASMHRIPGQISEVSMLDFVAPLIAVDAWKELGPLDTETLGMGWGLDIDWCYRARLAGKQMYVDSNLEIAHPRPSTTAKRLGLEATHQSDYSALEKKWDKGTDLLMNWVVPTLSSVKGVTTKPQDPAISNRLLHVCMPSRGVLSVPSHVFLGNYSVWGGRAGFGYVHQHIPTGKSVADAREECCQIVESWMDSLPDKEHWILWMDDDMDPPINAVSDMRIAIESSQKTDHQIGLVSGYCCRKEENDPGMVYAPKSKNAMLPLVDFVPGEIVEVEWCGLGFVLMKADWLKKLEKPFFKANWGGAEEDHYFTTALRKAGCIPYVHTGLPIGHYSVQQQNVYLPYIQPQVRSAESNGKVEHPQEIANA